jgi:von Willebrand factor type A domain
MVNHHCAALLGLDRRALGVTILLGLTSGEVTLVSRPPIANSLGKSPLTDPRSVGSSALFHVVLILLASLTAALNAALPVVASRPKALYAETDPVDNRADVPSSPGSGGGSPGEIGGLSNLPLIPPSDGIKPQGRTRDPAAETLLAEILPSPQPQVSDTLQRALPGPQTIGQGMIPGSGSGGGGGAGGGSGGGAGRGIGPGTQFFGARDHAHSFAYVIDCSGSMATRNSLEVAKREMLSSINQLPPDAQFAVIFYNLNARMLSDPQGQRGLMAATAPNKARVQTQLATIAPDGGTDHMSALREALKLKPEVIFFLTDADLMSNNDVNEILTEVGSTRIQAVEFGRGTELGQRTPLGRLATTTGGSYLYIDVSHFPRSSAGF